MSQHFAIAPVDPGLFARFYAVYAEENLYQIYDWQEWLEAPPLGHQGYFVQDQGRILGGFTLGDAGLGCPFWVAPFVDRQAFWSLALAFAQKTSTKTPLWLNAVGADDQALLVEQFGCVLIYAMRRMCRPTQPMPASLPAGFCFDSLRIEDLETLAQVVFAAHAQGYSSTVHPQNARDFAGELSRRFESFGITQTLQLGHVVRETQNGRLAGVCMAGIYPDSANQFSTVHQLSVHPDFQRRGLASAMLRRAIDRAAALSPVITLGVLVGNPAEKLYAGLGFHPGPRFAYLTHSGGEV